MRKNLDDFWKNCRYYMLGSRGKGLAEKMKNKIITILGGSGFVGRHVVQRLARRGDLLKIGCRDINHAMHLLPMGNPGQIRLIPTNVRDEASARQAIKGSDCVINLVGILFEKNKQTFQSVHVEAAQRIARICKEEGVQNLVHLSALGAAKESSSNYAKTKAEAEEAIISKFPDAVIFRPGLIYGAEDRFFNRFAKLATMMPFLPLINGGKTKFQPVFVGDVAKAVVEAVIKDVRSQIFELGGPSAYSFKELMQVMMEVIDRRRLLIPVPSTVAYGIGLVAQVLPEPFITIDQLRLLTSDSILTGAKPGLSTLGIEPKAIEAILPTYLHRFRKY